MFDLPAMKSLRQKGSTQAVFSTDRVFMAGEKTRQKPRFCNSQHGCHSDCQHYRRSSLELAGCCNGVAPIRQIKMKQQ